MTCGKRLNGKKTHRPTEGPVSISRLKKKGGGGRGRRRDLLMSQKKIYLIPT